jgi:hypothetical protein
MPESLLHKSQVHIPRDWVACERMFENVWMPFLGRQPGDFGHNLEDAKELRPVKPSALLRSRLWFDLWTRFLSFSY